MAKQSLNIIDFSGGVNSLDDKRDLEENQVVDLDSLISYSTGNIKLAGGFILPSGFDNTENGFNWEGTRYGLKSIDYFNPSSGFRIINKATVSVSSDVGTFTLNNEGIVGTDEPSHGLTTGTIITVFKGDSTFTNKSFNITVTGHDTFTAIGCTGLTNGAVILYATESSYDIDSNYLVSANLNSLHYILKQAEGKFGFYNIQNGTFYGSLNTAQNFYGGNSWLFDIKYLWDWHQTNQDTSENSPIEASIEGTPVLDSFYLDGIYRVNPIAPEKWLFGQCRRPMGLYYIDKKSRFSPILGEGINNTIERGWYPLRTHILGIDEYRSDEELTNTSHEEGVTTGFYEFAGTLSASELNDTTISNYAARAEFSAVTNPYQFNVGVGHGGSSYIEGDWQFLAGMAHNKIGLGISLIYDDIKSGDISRKCYSKITLLKDGETGEVYTNSMDAESASSDVSLFLYWSVYPGRSSSLTASSEFVNSYDENCIPEARGSGTQAHISHWNPRVVGATIWLTYDNDGPIDDPLYLAEVNFSNEYSKDGRSKSHDDIEATDWSQNDTHTGMVHQFMHIPTIPTLSYYTITGRHHTEQTQVWYKTSALAAGRLYAGNVSYFPNTSTADSEENDKISHFPDRILVSPAGKFDILPSTFSLDIQRNDGQDITKLESLNFNLLIFKNSDLWIVDTSGATGEAEVVTGIYPGYGVSYPSHVYKAREYIFWINKHGIYSYNGEQVANLIKDRLSQELWTTKMYTKAAHPIYDPQQDLLMVYCKDDRGNNDNRANKLIIINAKTGAVFYKTKSGIYNADYYSNGVYAENRLYISTNILEAGPEEFIVSTTTEHVPGRKAEASIRFKLAGSGTHGNGALCTNNNLNNAVEFLMIKKDGVWTQMNGTALISNNYSHDENAAIDTVELISRKCNHDSGYVRNQTFVNDDYIIDVSHHFHPDLNPEESDGWGGALFIIKAIARGYGTSYNITADADPGSFGHNSGIAFSSDGTSGNIGIGNVTLPIFSGNIIGIAHTAAVYTIHADRAGVTSKGVSYILLFTFSDYSTGEEHSFSITYIVGDTENYIGTYLDDSDTGISDAVLSDRITENLKTFYDNNLMTNIQQAGRRFYLTDFFSISSISGSSGSKLFTLTEKTNAPMNANRYSDYSLVTSITSNASTPGAGNLLLWSNETPLDTSGNPTIFPHDNIILETRDIDFAEPNIRKKVYKAYITYKGSDGNMGIYYQANQSGTWTAATVTDATTAGYLNDSSNQTRAEVTFGTGGNNIYSFALRFLSNGIVYDFEINDISLIYRIKKPK